MYLQWPRDANVTKSLRDIHNETLVECLRYYSFGVALYCLQQADQRRDSADHCTTGVDTVRPPFLGIWDQLYHKACIAMVVYCLIQRLKNGVLYVRCSPPLTGQIAKLEGCCGQTGTVLSAMQAPTIVCTAEFSI